MYLSSDSEFVSHLNNCKRKLKQLEAEGDVSDIDSDWCIEHTQCETRKIIQLCEQVKDDVDSDDNADEEHRRAIGGYSQVDERDSDVHSEWLIEPT